MPKPIPKHGLIGSVALREAATSEYGQIADLVRVEVVETYAPVARSQPLRFMKEPALLVRNVVAE